jgi:hypothetical protein
VKKIVSSIKKPFQYLIERPIIGIVVVVVVLVVVGGGAVLLLSGGGGGDNDNATTTSAGNKKHHDKNIEKAKKHKVKRAPVVNGAGTLDTARSVGPYAVAQGRGQIKHPSSVSVRVSAAPKQTVTVNYQLACYRQGHTVIGKGKYRTRPPDIRDVPLPFSGADQCIVTVGAQLTKGSPNGRIKVAITSG